MSGEGGKAEGKGLELLGKIDPEVLKVLVGLIQGASTSTKTTTSTTAQVQVKLDLPPVDLKLDGPATYLSWSRRIEAALVGKRLEGYLTGSEPGSDSVQADEWRTTHALIFTWLLNSMVPSIASSVDGIRLVRDIWAKLKRTYAGTENHMRVFQIQREVDAVVQGDRSIQEYAIDLERMWADLDHFSPMSSCSDSECKARKVIAQGRTMKFLGGLSSAFDQRRSVILSQSTIPSLDEAIAAMIQEESRMKLHSEPSVVSGTKALAIASPGTTGAQRETRRCYNCGEIGHLRQACPKPPKERESGGRGQSGGRGRGRGGRKGGGRGGYRTNLMVDEEEEEESVPSVVFSEEDRAYLEVLQRKQKAAGVGDGASTSSSFTGNVAYSAATAKGTCDSLALASFPAAGSSEWIIDSGASGHVTGTAREFSSYTRLAVPLSVKTADGTDQPVVGDLPREEDGQDSWDWDMA